MSSNGVKPTWMPLHSTLSSEEKLPFSLRLMNGRFWVRVSSGAGHSEVAVLVLHGKVGAGINLVLLEQLGFGAFLMGAQGLVPVGVSLGGSSEARAGFPFKSAQRPLSFQMTGALRESPPYFNWEMSSASKLVSTLRTMHL